MLLGYWLLECFLRVSRCLPPELTSLCPQSVPPNLWDGDPGHSAGRAVEGAPGAGGPVSAPVLPCLSRGRLCKLRGEMASSRRTLLPPESPSLYRELGFKIPPPPAEERWSTCKSRALVAPRACVCVCVCVCMCEREALYYSTPRLPAFHPSPPAPTSLLGLPVAVRAPCRHHFPTAVGSRSSRAF